MIEKMKKEEYAVLIRKLANNLINEPRLNPWEKEFVANITQQIVSKDLTEKQLNVLNKIKQKYARK